MKLKLITSSLLLISVCKPAYADMIAPSFCSAMEGEKEQIQKIINDVNSLSSGLTPNSLLLPGDSQEKVKQAEEYTALLKQTTDNIRKMAKAREESLYSTMPPASSEEYMKCCVLTCSYLSKNKDAYQ